METIPAAPTSSLAKQTDTHRIELSDVADGTGGFAIHGETGQDLSGISEIGSAGDISNDGLYFDLIIGAPIRLRSQWDLLRQLLRRLWQNRQHHSHRTLRCRRWQRWLCYQRRKQPRPTAVAQSALTSDINGDGLADLIIGAKGAEPDQSLPWHLVVFGKTDNTTAIELSDIADGTGGFVIHEKSQYDASGSSVSSAEISTVMASLI